MTAPPTRPDAEDTTTPASGTTSRTTTFVAGGLWVFVVALLTYGVVQTAVKAAALFG